jgi:translation initiation factor 2 alpha subunit (eIF-2alpha)
MNAALEQAIIEHLHALDDARLAEVLDFVEFLRHRAQPPQAPLTGLFSRAPASIEGADPVIAALAELRREREDGLERTIALIESE